MRGGGRISGRMGRRGGGGSEYNGKGGLVCFGRAGWGGGSVQDGWAGIFRVGWGGEGVYGIGQFRVGEGRGNISGRVGWVCFGRDEAG